jgi:hypothetical protein
MQFTFIGVKPRYVIRLSRADAGYSIHQVCSYRLQKNDGGDTDRNGGYVIPIWDTRGIGFTAWEADDFVVECLDVVYPEGTLVL